MADLAVTVDTDGVTGDYASLNAANVGEAQDLTDDGGDTMTITCQATAGAADTTAVDINGWTTGAGNTITVVAAITDRAVASGLDANRYRLELAPGAGVACLHSNEKYVHFDKLQIHNTSGASDSYGIASLFTHTPFDISNCYISMNDSGNGIRIAGGNVVQIWNCIVYNPHGGEPSEGIYATTNVVSISIYNCIVYGCDDGIERDSGEVNVHNCAVFNNNNDFDGTFNIIDYCASDDNDGTNNVAESGGGAAWPDDFEDAANGDFRLKSGSGLVGTGIDDPGSGLYSDDINGDTRTSTWDVGADEVVAVAVGGILISLNHRKVMKNLLTR